MIQERRTSLVCPYSLFVPSQRNQLLGGLRILIQSGNPYHQSADSGYRHRTKHAVHRYRQPWHSHLDRVGRNHRLHWQLYSPFRNSKHDRNRDRHEHAGQHEIGQRHGQCGGTGPSGRDSECASGELYRQPGRARQCVRAVWHRHELRPNHLDATGTHGRRGGQLVRRRNEGKHRVPHERRSAVRRRHAIHRLRPDVHNRGAFPATLVPVI